MKGLLNFYLSYKEVKPNLSVVDSADIILKRNKKIVFKLFFFSISKIGFETSFIEVKGKGINLDSVLIKILRIKIIRIIKS